MQYWHSIRVQWYKSILCFSTLYKKEEIETLKKEKDAIAKKLGEVIVERDCPPSCGVVASLGRAVGKLQSLDLSIRKELVDSEGNIPAQTKNVNILICIYLKPL